MSKDITCVLGGSRQIDRCATAIYNSCVNAYTPVPVQTIDRAVLANGSSLFYKSFACKALRNIGHPIVVHQARHMTTYALDPSGVEEQDWERRAMTDCYSRVVTMGRGLAVNQTLGDPLKLAVYRDVEMAAISLGHQIGIPAATVIAELVPLP